MQYCGVRASYYKHHTGLCMLPPHEGDNHLVEVVTEDTRKVDYGKPKKLPLAELHEHQRKAVDEMHNGCALVGGVGTGKTITALSYALEKEPGRDIYVITTAMKRDSCDWEHEAAKLGMPFGSLVVDSWNNIKNYRDIYGAFFILDEQRLVGTGAWVKAFYDIAAKNHWVLLTATPGDTWLDYAPLFIANGFYKHITEFRETHVVYKRFTKYPVVDKYIATDRLQRLLRLVLVPMPMDRHTTRHVTQVECDYDKKLFLRLWTKRWNVFTDEPIRDAGELFRVGRFLVGSDPSRVEAMKNLMRKHRRLIVFYNYDWELDILRKLGEEWNEGLEKTVWNTQFAERNGHKHEDIPDCESWVYLVQYQSGAESWNCTSTDAIAFFSPTYSYKQYEQSQGRIDRLDTPFTDLHYYVLMSKCVVDLAVLRALKNKRDFNVRNFASSDLKAS